MKSRKIKLILSVVLILMLTVGISYAFYYNVIQGNYNSTLIAGDIYLRYEESNQINIIDGMPMSKESALASEANEFNFQIIGKNTSSKDMYYGISIVNGEEIEGKTRINPEHINIYLESENQVLIDGVRYKNIDNQRIWVDTIEGGTTSEITRNYSLKVWIDENTIIGNTEEVDYTIEEWNNTYLSIKVNVDGNLENMNMPLSIETDETYVENNKAYFIAKISNFINMNESGINLQATDNMKVEITSTNSDVLFAYKDSEGGEDETEKESLNLEYNFLTNKIVELQVYVIPKNDANGVSDINIKLVKNDVETYEIIKRVEVVGENYCLNNGFNKLGDCILVSDNLSESVEVAKTQIANKGYPNLNDTAPSYTYVEEITQNVSNAYTVSSGYKYYFGTSYEFDTTSGTFDLTGNIVTDSLSDTYINYYTCGGTNANKVNCQTIYKVLETDSSNQRITLANKHTYKVASSIRSEQGLYEVEDDYGDSYIFRGDVTNNNVYFGGYYWKIIRMNGDGSIRMIYNGTTPNATGNATSINGTAYQYNTRRADPTYVGYMYGKDFELQTSTETTYTDIVALTKYYFADNYTFNEETEMFSLSGNIISEAKTFSEMNSLGEEGFSKYPYTCKSTSKSGTCEVIVKVNSYINETQVKAEYISYSSKSLEGTRKNDNDSNAKIQLDNWYASNIVGKRDSEGNLLTNYIVDGTFCNDRTFASSNAGNGFSLVPTTLYSAYKRLYTDTKKTATLKCSDNNDKFSTTTSRGNGKLTYPIALITADEVALAGAKHEMKNEDYYLKTNGYYFTMTPSYFCQYYAFALASSVFASGALNPWNYVTHTRGLRAVINIRSDVLISQGDGTIENPYLLELV